MIYQTESDEDSFGVLHGILLELLRLLSPLTERFAPVENDLRQLLHHKLLGDDFLPAAATSAGKQSFYHVGNKRRKIVVGIFGVEGSGKSSLVNAMVGSNVIPANTKYPLVVIPSESDSTPVLRTPNGKSLAYGRRNIHLYLEEENKKKSIEQSSKTGNNANQGARTETAMNPASATDDCDRESLDCYHRHLHIQLFSHGYKRMDSAEILRSRKKIFSPTEQGWAVFRHSAEMFMKDPVENRYMAAPYTGLLPSASSATLSPSSSAWVLIDHPAKCSAVQPKVNSVASRVLSAYQFNADIILYCVDARKLMSGDPKDEFDIFRSLFPCHVSPDDASQTISGTPNFNITTEGGERRSAFETENEMPAAEAFLSDGSSYTSTLLLHCTTFVLTFVDEVVNGLLQADKCGAGVQTSIRKPRSPHRAVSANQGRRFDCIAAIEEYFRYIVCPRVFGHDIFSPTCGVLCDPEQLVRVISIASPTLSKTKGILSVSNVTSLVMRKISQDNSQVSQTLRSIAACHRNRSKVEASEMTEEMMRKKRVRSIFAQRVNDVRRLNKVMRLLKSDSVINVPQVGATHAAEQNMCAAVGAESNVSTAGTQATVEEMYEYCETVYGFEYMQRIDQVPLDLLRRRVYAHAESLGLTQTGAVDLDESVFLLDLNIYRHLMMSIAIEMCQAVHTLTQSLQLGEKTLLLEQEAAKENLSLLRDEMKWISGVIETAELSALSVASNMSQALSKAMGAFVTRRLEELTFVLDGRPFEVHAGRHVPTMVEMRSTLKRYKDFLAGYLKHFNYFRQLEKGGPFDWIANEQETDAQEEQPTFDADGRSHFLHQNFRSMQTASEAEHYEKLLDLAMPFSHHVKHEFGVFIKELVHVVEKTRDEALKSLTGAVQEALGVVTGHLAKQQHCRAFTSFNIEDAMKPLLGLRIIELDRIKLNNFMRDLVPEVSKVAQSLANDSFENQPSESLCEISSLQYIHDAWALALTSINVEDLIIYRVDELSEIMSQRLMTVIIALFTEYKKQVERGIRDLDALNNLEDDLREADEKKKKFAEFLPILEHFKETLRRTSADASDVNEIFKKNVVS